MVRQKKICHAAPRAQALLLYVTLIACMTPLSSSRSADTGGFSPEQAERQEWTSLHHPLHCQPAALQLPNPKLTHTPSSRQLCSFQAVALQALCE